MNRSHEQTGKLPLYAAAARKQIWSGLAASGTSHASAAPHSMTRHGVRMEVHMLSSLQLLRSSGKICASAASPPPWNPTCQQVMLRSGTPSLQNLCMLQCSYSNCQQQLPGSCETLTWTLGLKKGPAMATEQAKTCQKQTKHALEETCAKPRELLV